MRDGHRLAIVALGMLMLPGAVWAQRRLYEPERDPPPVTARVTIVTSGPLSVRTTVRVPDGGTALAASYSQSSQVRSEFGAPVVGKLPMVGRTMRNIGYGRSITSQRVGVSARVIDLREEEYRQTGYRSP